MKYVYVQMPERREKMMEEMPLSLKMNLIVGAVSRYFQISFTDIVSKKTNRVYTYPRHMSWHLIRKFTKASQTEMTPLFSGNNRSNITFGVNKIKDLMDVDHSVIQDEFNLCKLVKTI